MNTSMNKYHPIRKKIDSVWVLSDNKSSIKEKCCNQLIPNKYEISKTKQN